MDFLRTIWSAASRGWMKFAHVLGVINTTLLLTIVYVFIIGPIAIVMKLFRHDPLKPSLPGDRQSFWKQKEPVKHTLSDSKRQF